MSSPASKRLVNATVHWLSTPDDGRVVLIFSDDSERRFVGMNLTQARLIVSDALLQLAAGKGCKASISWLEDNTTEAGDDWSPL